MTWHRYLRRGIGEHPARSALTALSVTLGVAIFLAVSIGTRTLSDALQPVGGDLFETDAQAFFQRLEASFVPISASALLLGGVLMHLVVRRMVQERRRAHGVLRAVGVSRPRLVALVVGEASLVAMAGTALGVIVGTVVSRSVAEVMGRVFSITLAATPELPPLDLLVAAVALGGVALAMPLVARSLAVALRPLLGRLGVAGELVAVRLVRRAGRTARTAGLLASSLALVVVVATLHSSGRPGFVDVVDANVPGDLLVSNRFGEDLPAGERQRIAAVAGVSGVAPVGGGRVGVVGPGGRTEFLAVIDPAAYFDMTDFAWTPETDGEVARRLVSESGHVLLEASIAARMGRATGDTVTLRTVDGSLERTVAGVYVGLGYGPSRAVVLSSDDARVHLGFTGPSWLLVSLEPGADRAGVAASIRSVEPGLSVWDRAPEAAEIVRQFDSVWALVMLIVVVTSGIGLLGLANVMVMDVLDRRHELGILRAIGIDRRDVRRVVALEAVVLGLIAGVVGAVAGSLLGWVAVAGLIYDTGVAMPVRLPLAALPAVCGIALVAGALAAVVPAHRAATLDPVEALTTAS